MSVLCQKHLQLLMISFATVNSSVYLYVFFFNQQLQLSNTPKICLYSILNKYH
ncbi:hypothetical protein NIES37_69330 (plasmid) [Tolypothrix tenuis PCC 7101]|uniref:Uncharacterized protein n=1 Tax=Tolypothrix tenuis PCC 7101 TaxID=231146 RepID=A0A1Z4NB41_9CYAN|nr:hypothetical protein NIES37_69330 [Tolypothrix tenuis PCC 7101]BAZ78157.1 hypothetical protein NIES50_67900 [Aulosira laxa NIES-50]